VVVQVFACKTAVSDAERHLHELLPKLAATAGVRTLSYVTIQNQGNYLLELPAARTDVPKGWDKVCWCVNQQRLTDALPWLGQAAEQPTVLGACCNTQLCWWASVGCCAAYSLDMC
jgi:hypothetical protein